MTPQPTWTALSKVAWAKLPENPHRLAQQVFSPKDRAYPQLLLAVEETDTGFSYSSSLMFTPDEGEWLHLGAEGYPQELHCKLAEMFHDTTLEYLNSARAAARTGER